MAGLKSTYRQKVYYFASGENRARFDREPARYAGKPSEATPSGGRIHMH
jgi:YHS domain-containing protein